MIIPPNSLQQIYVRLQMLGNSFFKLDRKILSSFRGNILLNGMCFKRFSDYKIWNKELNSFTF